VVAFTGGTGAFKLGPRTLILPDVTALNQNYPNPFNPSTTIVFDLGQRDGLSQHTRITVYDLLGRQVATLYDGIAVAGHYEVVWSGVNGQGLPVSSGVYFVRMMTQSGFTATRKILLVK
ncbi:T9SS type A sorting domain-containing protein, partial [Candidatus Neomarinimicrobiota bacterium]